MAAANMGYAELTFARSRTTGSALAPRRPPQRPPPFASKHAPSKWDDAHKWIASPTSDGRGRGGGSRKRAGSNRQSVGSTVVREVVREVDGRRSGGMAEEEKTMRRSVDWIPADGCARPAVLVGSYVSKPAVYLSQRDAPTTAIPSSTTFASPPSTGKSVSMRDMGTETTPVASQGPSRDGTPVRGLTPLPACTISNSKPCEFTEGIVKNGVWERQLQMNDSKLGKLSIAAWASKRREGKEGRRPSDPPQKCVAHVRAAAWEEAEKAKYLARFKREEIKIQVWENHLKAKAEAEIRKMEVEVERMRARAQKKLMSKLTSARHKAEERRAAAEAQRNRQARKTSRRADTIRTTGMVPSPFYRRSWCS